jgi:hypothetical protein
MMPLATTPRRATAAATKRARRLRRRSRGGGARSFRRLYQKTVKKLSSKIRGGWRAFRDHHWCVFWQERSHDAILEKVVEKANELERANRTVEHILVNTYRKGLRESARTVAWIFTAPPKAHAPSESGPITFHSTKLSVDDEHANLSTLRDLHTNYPNRLGGVQLDSYSSFGRRLAERVTLGMQFLSDSRRAFVFYRRGARQ